MAEIIPWENKKGRPMKDQKTFSSKGPKKGKELVILMLKNYFTYNPSNVANCKS